MPVNYDEVLADLRQMKADAEAGIAAIQRLASRTQIGVPVVTVAPATPAAGIAEDQSSTSVPRRIVQFLESHPQKGLAIADISQGAGVTSIPTLRGALGRLVKAEKIARAGRGCYRAVRPRRIIPPFPENVAKGPES